MQTDNIPSVVIEPCLF